MPAHQKQAQGCEKELPAGSPASLHRTFSFVHFPLRTPGGTTHSKVGHLVPSASQSGVRPNVGIARFAKFFHLSRIVNSSGIFTDEPFPCTPRCMIRHKTKAIDLRSGFCSIPCGKQLVENFQVSGVKLCRVLVGEDACLIRRNQLVSDAAPPYLACEYRDDEIH